MATFNLLNESVDANPNTGAVTGTRSLTPPDPATPAAPSLAPTPAAPSLTPTPTTATAIPSAYDDQTKTIMQTYADRQNAAQQGTDANRQLIGDQSSEDLYYQNQANQNSLSSEQESRRGFATNTALMSQLQDQNQKRVRDLEKQRDYLLLNNQAEGATRIDNLIAQQQTAMTNAHTQYINQLFQQQQEQRSQTQFDQQTQDRTRNFDLQNGINQPYYKVGNTVYDSSTLAPKYTISGNTFSTADGSQTFSNAQDFFAHSGLNSFNQIQDVSHLPYSKDNVFGDATQGFAYIDPTTGQVRQLSQPTANYQPLYTDNGQILYDARSGRTLDPNATGSTTGLTTPAAVNNNPGNLRAANGSWQTFSTPQEGFQALVNDVNIKLNGQSKNLIPDGPHAGQKLTADSTLEDMMRVYAPSKDSNSPVQYAATLAKQLGVTPQTALRQLQADAPQLAAAIAQHEDGAYASAVGISTNSNASQILNSGATMGPPKPGSSPMLSSSTTKPYDASNQTDALAMTWLQTGTVPKGNGKTAPPAGAVEARGRAIAQKLGLGDNFNPALATAQNKADVKSLVDIQGQRDQIKTNLDAADMNFQKLTSFMQQYKLNSSDIPLKNQLQQKLQASGVTGGAQTAAQATLQSALAGLHTEYSQILARGGQRNETVDKEAQKLIPGDLSPSELQSVVNYIKSEGQNVLKSKDDTITQIKGRFGQGSSSGSSANDPLGIR